MSVKVTVGQQTFIKKIVLGTPVTTARETLSIDEFTDFDVATKSDAQILVFDSSEGVFKNFTFDVGQGLAREYSPGDDKLVIAIDSDKTPVVTGILSKGNLTPTLDSTFDLGDSNRKWKDLHLSGSTIHLGGIKLKDSGGDFSVKDSTGTPVNIDLAGSIQQIRGFFSPGGDLSYDSATGRFEFDVEQVYTKANFDSDLGDAGEVLEKAPEEDIEAIENESEVIKFSTAVVAEAIKKGVSDIHIEPYRFSSRVRYRLDGMLQEQEQYKNFLHDNYGAVVTRFKIMGKLDIAERRLPQDGAINFKIEGKVVDLRLSILPTANNELSLIHI